MRTCLLIALVITTPLLAKSKDKPLVVHEWGTFTSLQDESGRSIGGINSNDEPLPKFVHRLQSGLIVNDTDDPYAIFSKSVARAHPDVTMRLETPVIYFHPPTHEPITVNVSAKFNGGILSEFYPKAQTFTTNSGTPTTQPAKRISGDTVGSLAWNDAVIGGDDVKLPVTNSHVWLAPRLAKSAPVTVGKESESYIFYRGLGHLDAPLMVTRSGDDIAIGHRTAQPFTPARMWLAEFTVDGDCAFHEISDAPSPPKSKPKHHRGRFSKGEFSADNVAKLREQMHGALVADGLYPDEAHAMLETWKLSYFKSPGQRLFFLVPRDWTDAVIPLELSRPAEITRVMVGRIELITPQQRHAIKQLAHHRKALDDATAKSLYRTLGRFAEPMLLDEVRQNPAAAQVSAK